MSRTFRRKNYEQTQRNSWSKQGSKTGGYYRQHDESYNWQSNRYREPTDREYYCQYWYVHGDSPCANSRTPSKWWKNQDSRRVRRFNERELFKWAFREEYEPMFRETGFENFWFYWD